MATIKDIAKTLGISEATVSRALSGKTTVNEKTRQRIIETAKEMNYFSDKPTSILTEEAKIIGLIIPEINANYYVQLISEIEGALRAHNISIILGLSDFKNENVLHYLKLFANKKVNGIICEISASRVIINELQLLKEAYRIPVLLLGELFELGYEDFDTIEVDETHGLTLAFDHLLSCGHRKIAMVGDIKSSSRARAFLACYQALGIPCPEEYVRLGTERFEEGGYLRMQEVMRLSDLPTAVIATYDACALGAMRAIHEAGLRIPDDISVIGIDNGREVSYYDTALTSVRRISKGLGESAVQMILEKIYNHESRLAHHLKIYPELIIRESTGFVPASPAG